MRVQDSTIVLPELHCRTFELQPKAAYGAFASPRNVPARSLYRTAADAPAGRWARQSMPQSCPFSRYGGIWPSTVELDNADRFGA